MENKKAFKCFYPSRINVVEKVITNKDYKKVVDDVAGILYDFYRQHQRNQASPISESGKPQTQPEELDESV
jgi:hypothetical protein